ncbi:MAG: retron St85 family effector protein, partial [Rhodobacteraceae bacterium]|nr:retron St85 family effector protein [Paracoccaceae bacterium]
MEHPLRSDKHKSLRKDFSFVLKNGFTIQRQSNIVFVCGGNDLAHMRRRFQKEFKKLLPDYEFFEPEFAMKNYFTLGDDNPFDISEFEELVGELAISIVLFPEAPGSFAETGYFSARPDLAKKIVLAIDASRQRSDSFISLGPAKKIHDTSVFQPNIQLNYNNPDFEMISTRIKERAPLHSKKQSFSMKKFSETRTFELFSLIQQIVQMLAFATTEDIEFILMGLYGGHISHSKVKKVISILVGAGRLVEVGEYGHLRVAEGKGSFLHLKDGFKTQYMELTVSVSSTFLEAEPELQMLAKGNGNVD